MESINSKPYWDTRFNNDWESYQGREQSRFFARLAIDHLPKWFYEQIKRNKLSVVDWGCALGDGTDIWSEYIDASQITGVDFSSIAINKAKEDYPALSFINEDWITIDDQITNKFDIVFSSNVLEHFSDPKKVLDVLCQRAQKAIVLALPYREMNRHHEHFFTFQPENISLELSKKFKLVWAQVVDSSKLPNTYWSGEQIILVYANNEWIEELDLSLNDSKLQHDDIESVQLELQSQLMNIQHEFQQSEQKWIEKCTEQEELYRKERYGLQIQLEQLNQLQIATQKDQSRLLESFAERERELQSMLLMIEREKSAQLQIHVERERELKEQIMMATKAGQESELVAISMQAEIDSMLESRFWRITSPLRKIMRYKSGVQKGLKQKIAKNSFKPVLIDDYELNKINTEKGVEMNNIDDLIELYGEGFIRAAYLTVLGREPDSKGFMYYLKKLNKGEHKLEILYQLRNSKEGKAFNTKLYGLDETIRRYKISRLPLMGWLKPSSENLDYKLRMLENQLFNINSHTLNDQYDSLKAKIVELEHYIADKEVYIANLLQELAESRLGEVPSRSLLTDELIVITGVPYDDVGGGQRGAQLARCALKTGRKVIYVYVYPKFDFDLSQHVESKITIFGLTHVAIDNITPIDMLNMVSSSATIVVEFPHPKILPYLDMAKNRGIKTVFELIDDWETSLGGDWFDLDVYKKFVAKADVVVGTAKILVERLVNLGRDDALYLPNAANEYIFDKYKTYTRPIDFPSQGKRTALYFGSLYGEWFSWEHVIAAAEHNINLNILLIGDNPGKKELPSNVYFLGAKQIDDLPGYLAYSDVAILPFVPGKISDAVSPIKVFEYLFSGKPVVSTRLPEIQDYPGVFIADDVNQFAKLCSTVSVTDELINNNDTFIAQNSWFYRLDQIVEKQKSENDQNISAVILIHNNKKIIGRCLETLILHGKNHLKEIIVVDNASSDGGAEYVERTFPNVRVIKNPVNGCSSGRNLGASVATGKYLVFFDSDQWFTSGSFFNEALCILESNADVGAVSWAAGWFDSARTDMGGMIADYCPNRAMNSDAMRHGYRTDIGYLGAGGFFIPKVTYDAIGGFDIFYDPTCFEDTDLSFKIKQLGLNIAYRDLTGIRHQPHQTTQANSNSDKYNNLFNRNSNYFKKKWEDNSSFFVDYLGN